MRPRMVPAAKCELAYQDASPFFTSSLYIVNGFESISSTSRNSVPSMTTEETHPPRCAGASASPEVAMAAAGRKDCSG